MKKLICLLIVLGLSGTAYPVYVDYAKIDFGNSGTAGTNETQIGDATARYSAWTNSVTSLTSDGFDITISASGGDFKFEFDDSDTSGQTGPFSTTQKQGYVQRDGSATAVNIAFTGLVPGDYTLDAAAGEQNATWSATAGGSISGLTGTANGTSARQAAWSFTVDSETGAQITITGAGKDGADRGKIAAMTMTYTPEPATIALLGLGCLAFIRKRR